MNRLCIPLLLCGLLLGLGGSWIVRVLVLAAPESASNPPELFPIVTRFELPRDYGYFIGDEIPLTLLIETRKDVVLDLVNLPHPGDKHGLFEIRHLQLSSSLRADATKVYRAAYTLQYFGPTPSTIPFGPLEILYALPDMPPGSIPGYVYQHLLTQPVMLHLTRISPLHTTQLASLKAPWDDQRDVLITSCFAVGMTLMLLAVAGWGREWYAVLQQRRSPAAMPLTGTEEALQHLHQEGADLFRPRPQAMLSAGGRLGDIIRTYLQTTYQVPAYTRTPAQLAATLNGAPGAQDLLQVLERCEALKYQQPSATSRATEQELWGYTVTLFETLHKDGRV
jgi:hypothetical protein